jgi:MFS family permease
VGGLLWGILGDKRGRLSVLFGSIFLYSIANIANAYVESVEAYGWLRLIAGIGLAGELGAAITLVSEVMPKETRGYGTAIVASFGILGAVAAALIGDHFDWRTAYLVGGGLGIALLVLRVSMYESGMYDKIKAQPGISRGSFWMLLSNRERFIKYMACIFMGIPIWFVIGILITFGPEMSKAIGVTGVVTGAHSIMYAYIGLAIGDLGSGVLSQLIKSRKKVVAYFLAYTYAVILIYLFSNGISVTAFYSLCVALGIGVGYWAVFVTNASEQFGTNIRATVATSVPNFVRGAVVPLTLSFQALKPDLGAVHSALIVGTVSIVLAYGALALLREPFGKDLNYLEE